MDTPSNKGFVLGSVNIKKKKNYKIIQDKHQNNYTI